ncbi:hypothetical protein BC937DRAFT_88640 [Endogone sp. FLAS-F59071]|nr:hypothetical protein BC937DRAFT_88640 [Endogone sp. FLAS-F59071]|eukprot:RUS18542.1 hypothetical protein BC937DRAFT_88640 [Endogone sp. FLAS-F59071]
MLHTSILDRFSNLLDGSRQAQVSMETSSMLESIEYDKSVEVHSMHTAQSPSRKQDGFKWLDGRGFKEENPKYLLPHDIGEKGRLASQHYQIRNYQAPVREDLKRGIKVLDVGCGPGMWTIDMAKEFPASFFFGTDITNAFDEAEVLPNCAFMTADTTKGLPFEDETFDYVFQRFQCLCFTEEAWGKVIPELMRVLKPGGYLELDSNIAFYDAGPACQTWEEQVSATLILRDINPKVWTVIDPLLDKLNLEDKKEVVQSVPVGWGDSELGRLLKENFTKGIMQGMRPQMLLVLGCSEEDYDELMERATEEMGGDYKPVTRFWRGFGDFGGVGIGVEKRDEDSSREARVWKRGSGFGAAARRRCLHRSREDDYQYLDTFLIVNSLQ